MFRKTKKGLAAVALTLSLASVMAAMSYTSASVTSDMAVKLANTQDSLLALSASEEHIAATTDHITADQLFINLNKGKDGAEYGVQPNSRYEWEDLFTVKNNSEHAVDVTVRLAQNEGSRIEINGKADGTKWTKLSGIHSAGKTITFTLEPGGEQPLDIQTKSLNGWEASRDIDLIVEGEIAK